MKKTLFDKVWDTHVISSVKHGPDILYIDKHLIHEVTSPQAFNMLKDKGISLFRPHQVVATADHNVPTENQHLPIQDALSRKQVSQLSKNCEEYGVELFGLGHPFQGIVHVIGPELGVTQPGMTMVCGDSHSSTHGAFGTIAFGIGTSQVAQVFASQCVLVDKPKSMRIVVSGKLHPAVELSRRRGRGSGVPRPVARWQDSPPLRCIRHLRRRHRGQQRLPTGPALPLGTGHPRASESHHASPAGV